MKTFLAIAWCLTGLYFVVASIGGGGGDGGGATSMMAMICGFMVARNLAAVVKA